MLLVFCNSLFYYFLFSHIFILYLFGLFLFFINLLILVFFLAHSARWYQSHKNKIMDPIQSIVNSLYTLKVYNKEEIKNLIKALKTDKNNIRNIEMELTEELIERNIDTTGGEILIEKKMKFIDKFIQFLIQWYKTETL